MSNYTNFNLTSQSKVVTFNEFYRIKKISTIWKSSHRGDMILKHPKLIMIFLCMFITRQGIVISQYNEIKSSPRFIVFLENDIFASRDQQYTNGFGLTWISREYGPELQKPKWSRPFFNILTLLGTTGHYFNFMSFCSSNLHSRSNFTITNALDQSFCFHIVCFVTNSSTL